MGKVTKEQVMDTFYRTLLLSDKMDELEELISGRGESFLPMITDESGDTVPEKLEALIKAMIESLKHYLLLEDRMLGVWEEEMYSCFLYCAMSMTRKKENRRDPSLKLTVRSQTFGDIIGIAEDVGTDKGEVNSYRDFLKVYYDWYRNWCRRVFEKYDGDFTDRRSKFCSQVMDALKWTFMKPEYFINLPRETRTELCAEYAQENWILENNNAVYMQIAKDPDKYYKELSEIRESDPRYPDPREVCEYYVDEEDKIRDTYEQDMKYKRHEAIWCALNSVAKSGSYEDSDLLRDLTPEQLMRYERERCLNKNSSSNLDYLMHGVDGSELQKRFQRFTELYYDNDRSGFSENVRHMVEAYLIENGLSPFAFGDDYGLVMYQVERAQKRIASEIERVKNI